MEKLVSFGKKLLLYSRCWRLLNLRKVLYFPHLLTSTEKRFLFLVGFVMLFSGIWLGTRIFINLTDSVPTVGETYSEGLLKTPQYINPIFAANDTDRDISRLVFSSLFTYSGTGALKTDLAQSYKISEGGKIYTVELRKNIWWHDNMPLTADDVLFTIKLLQNPQFKSPLRANWQGVETEKLDTYRLKFTLRTPYAPFVENLTLGILPKHLWEKISPEKSLLNELNLKPIGSGPYRFDKVESAKDGTVVQYKLIRNDSYYLEGPYLRKINFIFAKNEEELVSLWKRGKIDGLGAISTGYLKDFSNERINTLSIHMPRLFGLFFNGQKSKLLSEPQVRIAIAHALDKEAIAAMIATSGATPTDSPLPIGTPGYFRNTSVYSFDKKKSKDILAAAGWKDEDGDGVLEKKVRDKNKTEVLPLHFILTTSDWPDLIKAANAIQANLREVGISTTIRSRTLGELESSVIRPRNFELLLFGQVYGYEPDPFAFWHSSQIKDPGLNITIYSNKKVDQLLESTRKTSDVSVKTKNYEEIQKLIIQDLPAIFLYSQVYHYLLPTDLMGVNVGKISLPSDRFNETNLWYKETKRVFR